jgi:hypothetical protein
MALVPANARLTLATPSSDGRPGRRVVDPLLDLLRAHVRGLGFGWTTSKLKRSGITSKSRSVWLTNHT